MNDASVFFLIETTRNRRFAGKAHLCEQYLEGVLLPTGLLCIVCGIEGKEEEEEAEGGGGGGDILVRKRMRRRKVGREGN